MRGDARADLGVDRLAWEITDHPEEAFSRRFVPGSPDHAVIEREVWDDNNLGNAIANATPRARIRRASADARPAALRAIEAPTSPRDHGPESLLLSRSPAQASYGRRLVRLGAQLCTSDGSVTNRDHARAWLPGTLGPDESVKVAIDVPTPESSGRYALKFDLVFEGVDWFENCGSETTTTPLLVW